MERALTRTFLVAAAEMVGLFPDRRLDDRDRDLATGDRRLYGTRRSSIFEPRRCTLPGHRLRALDKSVLRPMLLNPGTDRENVHPLFRFNTDHWNIDRVHKHGCAAVADVDEGKTAMNAGIDADHAHE
ncbi:MAG TPA: hypothetical protein VM910_24615 [Bradyrhizobium sp.]|nr:hypothetical protein [Bradyrhizobium sp.]